MFEWIMDWIVDPVLDFLFRRHCSGKWHFSYLLPVVIVAFLGIFFLGVARSSTLLRVIGIFGMVVFGLANLILWIPREVGEYRDLRSYIAERKRKAEAAEKQATTDNEKDT